MAPLTTWLCHEDCDETGSVFEVGGGHVAKCKEYCLITITDICLIAKLIVKHNKQNTCVLNFRVVVRWQKSDGVVVRRKNVDMTIEDIRDNWYQICDFTEHSFPASIGDSNARIYQVLQEIDEQPVTSSRLTKNNLYGINPVSSLQIIP